MVFKVACKKFKGIGAIGYFINNIENITRSKSKLLPDDEIIDDNKIHTICRRDYDAIT